MSSLVLLSESRVAGGGSARARWVPLNVFSPTLAKNVLNSFALLSSLSVIGMLDLILFDGIKVLIIFQVDVIFCLELVISVK